MELEKEPRALAGERARTSGDAAHLLAILGGEVGRIPGLARAEALADDAGAPLVLVRDDLTDPEEEHEIAGCLFRLLLERCERRRLVRFVREALRALPHAPAWAILALPAVLHRIAWALEQGRIVIDNLN